LVVGSIALIPGFVAFPLAAVLRDNGAGVPVEDLDSIFFPFYTGRKGRPGLGLLMVQKVLGLYGGSIRAYNDDGACFEFTLRDYG